MLETPLITIKIQIDFKTIYSNFIVSAHSFRCVFYHVLFLQCSYSSFLFNRRKKQPYHTHISLDKMTVLVLVVVTAVFLLSFSEVISQCPPSSGKTLDVYNNNCIGFYRYLPDA